MSFWRRRGRRVSAGGWLGSCVKVDEEVWVEQQLGAWQDQSWKKSKD